MWFLYASQIETRLAAAVVVPLSTNGNKKFQFHEGKIKDVFD